MEKETTKSTKLFLAIGTITTWFTLGLRFYLTFLDRTTSIPEAIVRLLSFYTILTNILVAICFTLLWLNPKSRWGNFFSQQKTLTAITVYISIVAIVYNLILRSTWNPQGLHRVVDELLHVIIPVIFILYWFLFAPKVALQLKNIFPWLIYPLVYFLYILSRGAFAKYYPYPFMDVNTLGYDKVLMNSMFICIAFLFVSLLFVAIAKMMSRNSKLDLLK
jgi:hypothetical protein